MVKASRLPGVRPGGGVANAGAKQLSGTRIAHHRAHHTGQRLRCDRALLWRANRGCAGRGCGDRKPPGRQRHHRGHGGQTSPGRWLHLVLGHQHPFGGQPHRHQRPALRPRERPQAHHRLGPGHDDFCGQPPIQNHQCRRLGQGLQSPAPRLECGHLYRRLSFVGGLVCQRGIDSVCQRVLQRRARSIFGPDGEPIGMGRERFDRRHAPGQGGQVARLGGVGRSASPRLPRHSHPQRVGLPQLCELHLDHLVCAL